MKKLFINLVLCAVAILLSVVLIPIGILWAFGAFFFQVKLKEGIAKLASYFLTIAVSIDQIGNVFCAELFNDALIKPKGHSFGNEDETISSVLGRNKLSNTLTWAGNVLDWILDKIDKNHSVKSIED